MRPEKKGTDRAQLALGLLEEAIASDAFVRVIDLFVDQLGGCAYPAPLFGYPPAGSGRGPALYI